MNCGSRIALGMAGGYLLGRKGKARWLVVLGALVASRGVTSGLAQRGVSALGQSPEVKSLVEQGRSAAMAAVSDQIEALTGKVHARTEALKHPPGAGGEPEPESARDESDREGQGDEDGQDGSEREEPEDQHDQDESEREEPEDEDDQDQDDQAEEPTGREDQEQPEDQHEDDQDQDDQAEEPTGREDQEQEGERSRAPGRQRTSPARQRATQPRGRRTESSGRRSASRTGR